MLAASASVLALSSVASSAVTKPLSIDSSVDMRSFGEEPFSVTSDGTMVAFSVKNPARKVITGRYAPIESTGVRSDSGTELWIMDVASGKRRLLSAGRNASWGPSWSPDGRYLAFYSDATGVARLMIWDRAHNAIKLAAKPICRSFLERCASMERKQRICCLQDAA